MKNFLTILISTFLIISLIGCDSENNNGFDKVKMFKATVIEVRDKYLIVEPFEDYSESKSADRIEISISHLDLDFSITKGSIL